MTHQSSAAASSYDKIAQERLGDWSSQRVAFRHFNNYVKKQLIQRALDVAYASSQPQHHDLAVLDLGSGRGGDLGKWMFMQSPVGAAPTSSSVARTSYYSGYDISPECVEEAQRRLAGLQQPHYVRFDAHLHVADCFSHNFFTSTLTEDPRFGSFDVVSIQFAMHYACCSEESIAELLTAIAQSLRPGGAFIATTVSIEALSKRVAASVAGNTMYQVELEDSPTWEDVNGSPQLRIGTKYNFRLDGFVDCPEYVVPMAVVKRCAEEVGLILQDDISHPFTHFLQSYQNNWKAHKGNSLTAEEVELVSLYRALCFVRS